MVMDCFVMVMHRAQSGSLPKKRGYPFKSTWQRPRSRWFKMEFQL